MTLMLTVLDLSRTHLNFDVSANVLVVLSVNGAIETI